MAGPGRFATPDKFEIVKKFLNPLTDLTSFQLAPGAYTKQMLWTAFGISLLEQDFSRRAVLIDQTEHDDGKDDFLERAYIWNTTAFSIKDGARFIVEMNGTRYIEDFAVVPFLNRGVKENFDFVAGSTFGYILNSLMEPKVDPSKIGRRVDFDFSTNRTVQGRFTLDDYIAASTSSSAAPANLLLGAYILANGTDFVDRLYNSGATKFLDNTGRFIAYDGTGANSLSPATFDNIAIDRNLRVALNTIGIHLIGGSGSDTLLGGAQYGDNRVSKDAQGNTYTQVGNGRLIVNGNIIIEGYSAGTLGLTMTGAVADVSPVTIAPEILGDLKTDKNDLLDDTPGNDSIISGTGNDQPPSTPPTGDGNDWVIAKRWLHSTLKCSNTRSAHARSARLTGQIGLERPMDRARAVINASQEYACT